MWSAANAENVMLHVVQVPFIHTENENQTVITAADTEDKCANAVLI